MSKDRRDADSRGQTQIDYVIGVSIFLLTAGFILAFAPGIIDPFAGQPERPVTADRAASHLSEAALVESAGERYVLNATCTYAFFEQLNDDGTDPPSGTMSDCGYDTGWSTLNDATNQDSVLSFNVTIEEYDADGTGFERRCIASDGTVHAFSGGSCSSGTPMTIGDDYPRSTDTVTVAQRTVWLDGELYRLFVRVW